MLRPWLQLAISPRAVAAGVYAHAVRRHVVALALRAAPALRFDAARDAWARHLLEAAEPPPHAVLEALLDADETLFGEAIRGNLDALLAHDLRFAIEQRRGQSLHPLLVALWHGAVPPALAARVHARVATELAQLLRAPHGYPMDDALLALTLWLCLVLHRHARLALPADVRNSIHRWLRSIVDRCLADSEYRGALSNNHHLTGVACLHALLAVAHDTAFVHRLRAGVRQQLLAAVESQFDADGAHFEHSSGYHMCCLELLQLAALAELEDDDLPQPALPQERLLRLRERAPSLAAALQQAHRFAHSLLRPDGTYPLIGDFDASRILRLHARYVERPVADAFEIPGHRDRLLLRRLEIANGDAVVRAGVALFGLPAPARCRPAAAIASRAPRFHTQPSTADREAIAAAVGPLASRLQSFVCYEIDAATTAFGTIRHFRQAGLIVAQAPNLQLTLRSGAVGQLGLGTHSHLDHLSIDLATSDGPLVCDPGSRAYAACRATRDRYRDFGAHFTPLWQVRLPAALRHPFALAGAPPAARLHTREQRIWGVAQVAGHAYLRLIRFDGAMLRIVDASSAETLAPYPFEQAPPAADRYLGALQPWRDRLRPDAPSPLTGAAPAPLAAGSGS